MIVNKLLALFCSGSLVLAACSVTADLGTSSSGNSSQQDAHVNQVSTTVAQTLGALTQTALFAIPSSTPTPTATATAMPSTLSVSLATDCYTGPNTRFGFVTIIRPGTVVNVVGKDTADNYWIIGVPGYPGSTCWLSGQYASVTGDVGALSSPATPIPSYNYTYGGRYDRDDWCAHSSHWGWSSHGSHHWNDRRWDCR
jgi:hypothetical protein